VALDWEGLESRVGSGGALRGLGGGCLVVFLFFFFFLNCGCGECFVVLLSGFFWWVLG
jgi:hypothetical protein